MEENAVAFDISSDEEPALNDVTEGDDYSWLTRLLCDDVDSSDEVVVVGEIKSKSSKPAANSDDEDDCVVLDGDPDKPVEVDDDQSAKGDDLVVVGHKGQIACRDYPHPRHLCAKFPFSSTAHETHCELCHCYVCEIPVPCKHWVNSVSSFNHCHATEKVEFWKSQRKKFRLQNDAPVTIKAPDTLPQLKQNPPCDISVPLSQLNQNPPHDINRLSSNSIPLNQVSQPALLRTCSPSTRLAIPNMITPFRNQQLGPNFNRNRFPEHSVPQQSQMRRARNNVIGNPGMFKRAGIAGGASEVIQFVHGSSNNTRGAYESQCTQDPAPRATSNDWIHIQSVPSVNHDSFTYQSTPQTGMGNVFASSLPSQSQVYSQPLPQPEVYSQPMAQQPVYSQPMAQQPVYSQPILQPQPCGQPITQPPVCSQHFLQMNNGHNLSQPRNQRQSVTSPDFSEFDEWLSNSNLNNQQPQVDSCQLPKAGPINEPLLVEEFNSEFNGSAKVQYDYTGYDNSLPDGQYVPSEVDVVTPDPAAFDAGMLLFDFETSVNGLAHA